MSCIEWHKETLKIYVETLKLFYEAIASIIIVNNKFLNIDSCICLPMAMSTRAELTAL